RRRCKPISTHASITRRPPDWTRNSTSRRPTSCLLIDNTATTAHLPGPQNPGKCHLYIAEGCHLYIALTAVELKIVTLRRHVVDHQHRRMPRPQEVLQRENLSPITQRVLRQQPHLGQRVDDDAGRVDALDLTTQQPHRLAQLDFRG